jgi:hypothetical protein
MRRKSKFTRLAREILGLALLVVKLAAAVWDLVSKAVDWTERCFRTSNGPGNAKANSSSLRQRTRTGVVTKSSSFASVT